MKRPAQWYRDYTRRRIGTTPHGTQNGYVNWSCRCDLCTTAHREHVAAWRATR